MLDVGVEPTATRLKVARSTTELTERILYVIHPDGAHPIAIFFAIFRPATHGLTRVGFEPTQRNARRS